MLKGQHPCQIAALSARVGSIGDNQLGGWYGYRMAKAALNQGLRCASIELTRLNPQSCVLALHPGTTDTALSRPFRRGCRRTSCSRPAFAAERLLAVLAARTPAETAVSGLAGAVGGLVAPLQTAARRTVDSNAAAARNRLANTRLVMRCWRGVRSRVSTREPARCSPPSRSGRH